MPENMKPQTSKRTDGNNGKSSFTPRLDQVRQLAMTYDLETFYKRRASVGAAAGGEGERKVALLRNAVR